MATNNREFAYDVVPIMRGDRSAKAVRITCAKCEAKHDFPVTGRPPPPEVVARWAVREGWQSNAWRRSACVCPACIRGKTKHTLSREPILNPEKVIPMPETKPAPVPRELTQQERLKIRAILDRQFDDGAGCYLDGYSDQKIGEEVGVPWALVTKIREAAYGPIRVDPEVAALRADLTMLRRAADELSDKVAAMELRLAVLTKKRAA